MGYAIHMKWEGYCRRCGQWHHQDEMRKVGSNYNAIGYGWIVIYRAPCGREIETHGADPAYNIRAFYLEDAFAQKRAVIPDTVTCPGCREALQRDRERFWNAWQWASGTGIEPHARIGHPATGSQTLCELNLEAHLEER